MTRRATLGGSVAALAVLAVAAHLSVGNAALVPSPSLAAQMCLGKTVTHQGTSGIDNIVGTPGRDVINSLGGEDRIDGQGGDDRICAGDGNDYIVGGGGNDRMDGQRGADTVSSSEAGE